MIVILFVVLFFTLIALAKRSAKKPIESSAQPKSELDEVREAQRLQDLKVCPPHKWRHHEIKDANGNLVHWKLICDLCGPLGSQETPKREI